MLTNNIKKTNQPKRLKWTGQVLALVICFLCASCGRNDAANNQRSEREVAVGVMCADTASSTTRTVYVGTAEESRSVDMTFKYGGTIDRITVKVGSKVRKGDLIASVSSSTLSNSQRTAQATLQQARDGYERLKKVYESGSLAEVKWVEMLTNLEKAEANADLANDMLAESSMYAPFNGTVTSLHAEVGENVSPLKMVARLISTDGAVVKIPVPETEISRIQKGDSASICIAALDNKAFSGKVVEKGMIASPLSHTYDVKISVSGDNGEVLPGMVGRVTLNSDMRKGIVIPANAVLIGNESKFVWTAQNGHATRRNVTIDGYVGTGVMISDGLKVGDTVVVEGYQKISEGMKLKCRVRE